jgi:uncharacterized protein (TIGR02453 family)
VVSGFGGFPPALFEFYRKLGQDNSKEFWEAHRSDWQQHVREPVQALLAELDGEFGPLRMFRPHRDVRFSKDKSPYKLWAGATSESKAVGGIGYHLSVDAAQLVIGFGAMAMDRDQLHRFRAALDEQRSGEEFASLAAEPADRSLPVTPGAEPPLKRVPRGYPADHPRAEFLRWKGAAVVQEDPRAEWMHTRDALDHIRDIWHGCTPLRSWLRAHVAG